MQISQPLGFYFPGTVYCVDDNLRLLKGLQTGLAENFNIKIECHPQTALDLIAQQANISQCEFIKAIDDSNLDQEFDCPVNIRISKIIEYVYQTKRFAELTVLVVDQNMPGICGIELCCQFKDKSFKKIMLTGDSTNNLAIDAFNNGLIDHFISKNNDQDLIAYLGSAINHLQQRYFQERSALILGAAYAQSHTFLKSKYFLVEFNSFLTQFNILEFYLLDTTGSFLGLDAQGEAFWFLVKSKKTKADFINIAHSSDIDFSFINSLKEERQLLYFLTANEHHLAAENWVNLAHPITAKHDDFYIAIVKGKLAGFNADKINAYERYPNHFYDAK